MDLEISKSNDMTSLGPGRTVQQSIVARFFDCAHLFNDSVRVCVRVIWFQLCSAEKRLKYLFTWPVKVKTLTKVNNIFSVNG